MYKVSRGLALKNLQEKLWPNHDNPQLKNKFLFEDDISVDVGSHMRKKIKSDLISVFVMHPNIQPITNPMWRTCNPLRRFVNLGLFDAKLNQHVDTTIFHTELCYAFSDFNKAIQAQKELDSGQNKRATKLAFEKVCDIVIENVNLSHPAFRRSYTELFLSLSKKTAGKMDVCVAGAVATVAASALSWAMQPVQDFSPQTIARITADVVPTMAVVGRLAFTGQRHDMPKVAKAFAVSLIASLAQIFRGSHKMTSRLHATPDTYREPLLANILPIALTLYSSKFSTHIAMHTLSYNAYLTVQDFAHLHRPWEEGDCRDLTSLLDRYRERKLLTDSLTVEKEVSVADRRRYISEEEHNLIREIDILKRLHGKSAVTL